MSHARSMLPQKNWQISDPHKEQRASSPESVLSGLTLTPAPAPVLLLQRYRCRPALEAVPKQVMVVTIWTRANDGQWGSFGLKHLHLDKVYTCVEIVIEHVHTDIARKEWLETVVVPLR